MPLHALKSVALCLLFFYCGRLPAQNELDSVSLKPLKGASIRYASLVKNDSIVLICFWSSSSEPSLNALNAINKQFESWTHRAKFRMLAVCVDEGRDLGRVRPLVNSLGWVFDVFIDINGDLRKNLKSVNLPQAFILFKGDVVYQQSGFGPGSEDFLIRKIQSVTLRR